MTIRVENEAAMETLGSQLAGAVRGGEIIHLQGELGVGKTTLVRGLLHGLGHRGKVKSPTYTLVEEYSVGDRQVFHFDLYRLNDPEELEEMGIRDYYGAPSVCLFEWPEQADGVVPAADLTIQITHAGAAREVTISAASEPGKKLAETIA